MRGGDGSPSALDLPEEYVPPIALSRGRKPKAGGGGGTGMSPRLPPIVVDSSFTYAPKPRGRPPKYGAWYVPVKEWQVGGLAPPPEELTPDERKARESQHQRREVAKAMEIAGVKEDDDGGGG
eukprot:SAG22_NODE_8684_length_637_cov_0.806691_1_plen_122_part_01